MKEDQHDDEPSHHSPSQHPFQGTHLNWPYERQGRPFVVRVIEPLEYKPTAHAELFNSAITELFAIHSDPIDGFDSSTTFINQDRFDLATFPEAFVPVETLVSALTVFADHGPSGCIHVGLRPSVEDSHLFSVDQAKKLANELANISAKAADDLTPFSSWLNCQHANRRFNLGCLFVVDAEGALRICLHPKIVRSRFETSPLPEQHMTEADFLTLVTLVPVDKQYMMVSLQPLICSDVLDLQTDRVSGGPLTAVSRYATCFDTQVPDHIDVVSVATCSPQVKAHSKNGRSYRDWHGEFQDMFRSVASASDYQRHHFSAVVLANFQEIGSKMAAGLSGLFLPVPPSHGNFPEELTITCWGRPIEPGGGNNRWSMPDDDPLRTWENRGFIASLVPSESDGDVVRILGCNIHRLPRDNSLWRKPQGLTGIEVRVGQRHEDGSVIFMRTKEYA